MVAPDTGAAVVGAGSGVNATTSLTGGELILTTTSAWGSTTGTDGSTVSTVAKCGVGSRDAIDRVSGDTGVSTTGSTEGGRGSWLTVEPFLATGSVTGKGWLSTILVVAGTGASLTVVSVVNGMKLFSFSVSWVAPSPEMI